ITYGDRAAARAAADRVRKVHERVTGTDPVTGQPYAAGDPALLIWVHAELVGIPATSYAQGGAPASVAELHAYFDAVRPALATSRSTADTAEYLLRMPDVEPELAEAWQVLAAAAVTALPDWARAMYGFGDAGRAPGSVPPGREEVRQVLGVLDAVYLGEPGVLEARQRLAVRRRQFGRGNGAG